MDRLLYDACAVAEAHRYDRIEPEHLLFALLSRPDLRTEEELCGYDPFELALTLDAGFRYWRKRSDVKVPRLIISDRVMQVLELTEAGQARLLPSLLDEMRFSASVVKRPSRFREPLPDLDAILDEVEREQAGFDRICDDVFRGRVTAKSTGPRSPAAQQPDPDAELLTEPREEKGARPSQDRSSLSGKERQEAKRAVERSIRDLTALHHAGELDPVIGREPEIDQVCRVLMRRRKSNVLLVGEPGVGKTALMEGVAARIATSTDPALSRRPVLQASLGALVAGARYRGDFEIRMELLVEHALARKAILFFDEMQMLIGAGATAERGMDGANLLKPVLARDGMSLVGATTHEEAQVIREDPALIRRFEPVTLSEPDPELMRTILAGAAGPYLAHHDVRAEARVLNRLIEFADRYLPDRRFPDKAFDLLDAACVETRVSGRRVLRVENLRAAVRQLGGTLPAPDAPADPRADRDAERMALRLADRVGGHPDAVREVASLVWAGDRSGPVLVQLAGPRGVGRRTLAREVSRLLGGPLRELDLDAGPDRLRGAILAGLRPGSRTAFLLNAREGLDSGSRDLLSALVSTGTVSSETGRRVSLDGTVFFIRQGAERRPVGFNPNTADALTKISNIKSVEMRSFAGEALRDAVRFELGRLSRLWSDSGVSRPVPDVETVLYGVDGPVSSWSEIVRICEAAIRNS